MILVFLLQISVAPASAALLLRRLGWPASLLRSQYLPEHSLQLDQELLPAQRPAGSLVQAQFVDLLRIAVIEE